MIWPRSLPVKRRCSGVGSTFGRQASAHHNENMKTKQLANILIKILGLSALVHGIPSFLAQLLPVLRVVGSHGNVYWNDYWVYPLSSAVSVAIGIYLIVKSRAVAAFLFKDESE